MERVTKNTTLACFVLLGALLMIAWNADAQKNKPNNGKTGAAYKASCARIPIGELTQNAAKFKGKKAAFTGKLLVFQTTTNGAGKRTTEMILSIKDDSNTLPSGLLPLYVNFKGGTDAFINDTVEVFGKVFGDYDYESKTMGIGKKRLPRLNAKFVNKIEQ